MVHQAALLRYHLTCRIATELIETKLLWAEAQEQIVKLKQVRIMLAPDRLLCSSG